MTMPANRRQLIGGAAALAPAALLAQGAVPAPLPPRLRHAFSVGVRVASALELGRIDEAQRRFVPILGGTVDGPMLTGEVLSGGGDWQDIRPGGLAEVEARYFLKANDSTIIGVENIGVRVASEAVTADLARGVPVDPSAYYFRTTPRFTVQPGPHEWLRRAVFVAQGIRQPTLVKIDIFIVD